MPAAITLVNLPYQTNTESYFHCLREFNGVVWLDGGLRATGCDVLSSEPIARFINADSATLKDALAQLDLGQDNASLATLPFTGGLIGAIDYEDQHSKFGLGTDSGSDRCNVWQLYDWALVQDHKQKKCTALFLPSCSEADIKRRLKLLKQATVKPQASGEKNFRATTFKPDISRSQYQEAFKKIQNYILDGDAYQVNFAQRFSAELIGDKASAYCHLRHYLSGNYSAYLDLGEQHILSFSPEQFVQIRQGKAQTKPIKGTARRGQSPEQDKSLANELVNSVKNRAENLMIVDLLRNDFSKNCRSHSVKVPKLYALESYANVHHLVSTVTGELRAHVSPIDFLFDCFPGGSITGAPKKRAMEIIAELEQHPRGIYCGSIAYVSANGNVDSSIAIRTLKSEQNKIYCWGGGGIVADSLEEEEYQESIQKVQILMSALSNQE